MVKITKRAVGEAAATGKLHTLWDDTLKGFGLRITPGGVKSYVIVYRNAHRRQRWMTIGRAGVLTPDEARGQARQLLAAVHRGEDPAADRQERVKSIDMNAMLDKYVAEHVRIHNKNSSRIEVERILKNHIRPRVGRLKVSDVHRSDLMRLHHDMRNTPRTANYARAILSKAFNLAEQWGLRPEGSNPCLHVPKYPEVKRERFLSSDEIARLGAVLAQAESASDEQLSVVQAVRLLILTGCRLSEILNLRWTDVDAAAGVLCLPDTKTGARVHSVGAPVLALLEEMAESSESDWVVPHPGDHDQSLQKSTIEKAWRRMRVKAELQDVRLHDLRHTLGTHAASHGANAFLIRDKLGHADVRTTDRYVNRDNAPLRELSDRVEADLLSSLARGALKSKNAKS